MYQQYLLLSQIVRLVHSLKLLIPYVHFLSNSDSPAPIFVVHMATYKVFRVLIVK